MIVTKGKSAYTNKIAQTKTTFDDFFKTLKKPVIRKDKDGPYFILAKFKSNVRLASNTQEYYGAAIDLDDTPLSLDEIRLKFKRYEYVIYTTFNHKVKGDRYRLILPYKKPVKPEQHVKAMLVLLSTLGADAVDMSSKALARPMYLPACTQANKKHFFYCENESRRRYDARKAEITPDIQFELDQSVVHKEKFDANDVYSEGGRNEAMTRLVGKFIKNGMDRNTILSSAEAWNDRNCEPPLSDDDVQTIVESVFNGHKRNSEDGGWGYDEVLRRIRAVDDPAGNYESMMSLLARSSKDLKTSQRELLLRELAKRTKMPLSVIRTELRDQTHDIAMKKDDAVEEKLESSSGDLTQEFIDWVYLSRDHKVINTHTGLVYKPEGFNAVFSPKVEKSTMLGVLLKYGCIKTADLIQFNPSENSVFRKDHINYANTYIQPEVFGIEGRVSTMMRHMKYLIPDDIERKCILDFIAFLIQKPGEKVKWMPIIKGYKGIGKSLIADKIIVPMLGRANVKPVTSKLIKSDFNSWQLDTQLVVFHELKVGDTRAEKLALTDSLKEFITEDTMLAHRKGLDPYPVDNYTNVMGFTNHEDAVLVTPDERRFVFIRSEAEKRRPKYYKRLVKWLESHVEEMFYFFENRDLKTFDEQTPVETAYGLEIKGASEMWPSNVINDMMADPKHPFITQGCLTWQDIVFYIQTMSSGRDVQVAENLQSPSSSQSFILNNCLREKGFRRWSNNGNASSRLRIHGKQHPVWIAPGFVRYLQGNLKVKKILEKKEPATEFNTEDVSGEE